MNRKERKKAERAFPHGTSAFPGNGFVFAVRVNFALLLRASLILHTKKQPGGCL